MIVVDTKSKRQIIKIPFTRCGHGIEGIFVPLDETCGLKLFDSREHANRSRTRQKQAYAVDAAPMVLSGTKEYTVSKFACARLNRLKKKCYGYKTQRVDIADDYWPWRGLFCRSKKLIELEKKLKKIGFPIYDLHQGNVGTVNNMAVCVDFGDISTGSEEYH